MIDIAVVDYGMGNLRSVAKALEHVAPAKVITVTSDPAAIRAAERVVFPGQGAMPDCMREMDARGLRAAVLEAARTKPFLGLCIGLQMLFEQWKFSRKIFLQIPFENFTPRFVSGNRNFRNMRMRK